jgi:hypothetical protein
MLLITPDKPAVRWLARSESSGKRPNGSSKQECPAFTIAVQARAALPAGNLSIAPHLLPSIPKKEHASLSPGVTTGERVIATESMPGSMAWKMLHFSICGSRLSLPARALAQVRENIGPLARKSLSKL